MNNFCAYCGVLLKGQCPILKAGCGQILQFQNVAALAISSQLWDTQGFAVVSEGVQRSRPGTSPEISSQQWASQRSAVVSQGM